MNQKLSLNDKYILSTLRKNARSTLKDIARTLKIPSTTAYDRIRKLGNQYITRSTILLDYSRLPPIIRTSLTFRAKNTPQLSTFLKSHPCVNTAQKTTVGFLISAFFSTFYELDKFCEEIERLGAIDREIYHVLEEVKSEAFLTEPKHFGR